jgi:hypothetical protein
MGEGPRGKPRMRMGIVNLPVRPEGNKLVVSVETDRKDYRPGAPVTATVKVTDGSGKPVSAEVSITAADEGVLSLIGYQTPDPIPTFYALEPYAAWENERRPNPPQSIAWISPGGFKAFEHQWAMAEAFEFHSRIGRTRIANRIAALLSNLLVNAVRYGEPDPIRIELRGDARSVELHVSNRGRIDPQILPVIFDPFCSAQRRTDGLGLGLFICRAIAQAHGGEIEARYADGVIHFITRLPRDRDRILAR